MDAEQTITAEATATEADAAQEPTLEFAIVEIMGHRRLAGRVMEVERVGVKMLRIDVPTKGDFANGFVSQFYSGASLFSVTNTDLETVCRMNKPYEPARLMRRVEDGDDADPDDEPF